MDRDSLYYEEAVRQTKEQEETRRHFDTMATTVLGFSAVLIGLVMVRGTDVAWAVIPLIMFLGVALSTIVGLWLRRWELNPPLTKLYEHMGSLEFDAEALVLWTGQSLSDSLDNNKKYLRHKAYCLRCAYVFLVLEAISAGAILLFLTRSTLP